MSLVPQQHWTGNFYFSPVDFDYVKFVDKRKAHDYNDKDEYYDYRSEQVRPPKNKTTAKNIKKSGFFGRLGDNLCTKLTLSWFLIILLLLLLSCCLCVYYLRRGVLSFWPLKRSPKKDKSNRRDEEKNLLNVEDGGYSYSGKRVKKKKKKKSGPSRLVDTGTQDSRGNLVPAKVSVNQKKNKSSGFACSPCCRKKQSKP